MSRSWSLTFGRLSPTSSYASGQSVSPNLVERPPAVGGVLAGKVQHSLADHVARHLGGAAADAGDLTPQITRPDVKKLCVIFNYSRRTRDGLGRVGFRIVHCSHGQPDDRSRGRRQRSAGHGVEDVLTELRMDRAVEEDPPDHLPDAFNVVLVRPVDQRPQTA